MVNLWKLLYFFSISWSPSSLRGVNLLAKRCSKISDFSLLLHAQGHVVDVVVRIGG
jgi:hypothetical protein